MKTIVLEEDELALIHQGLGELPLKLAYRIYCNIQAQILNQVQSDNATEKPGVEVTEKVSE